MITNLISNLSNIHNEVMTKLVPENIKNNVTILNVTGTYEGSGGSGDVKLFDTVANMQADPNPSEGDLAVVYNFSLTPITDTTIFNKCIFPETVVLPQMFTGAYFYMFQPIDDTVWEDVQAQFTRYDFTFSVSTDDGDIEVKYTSSDGINYTRISDEEIVTLPIAVQFMEEEDPWDSNVGYFMQTSSSNFNGLYTYSAPNWENVDTQLNAVSDFVYKGIYYGRDGVETGTLQVTNINSIDKLRKTFEVFSAISELNIDELGSNLADTFRGYAHLKVIPNFDTSNVVNMCRLFYSCHNLKSMPELNTSKVSDVSEMFEYCYNLTLIPNLNFGNASNMSYTFCGCRNLKNIPDLNTVKVTNMFRAFSDCSNVETVTKFNTATVLNLSATFSKLSKITSIPDFDTSNAVSMSELFSGCSNLSTVPQFNTSKCTNMMAMFRQCNNLSNASIHNVVNMCLNSNVTDTKMTNLNVSCAYSPLGNTKFNSSYYSDRLTELTQAGWFY